MTAATAAALLALLDDDATNDWFVSHYVDAQDNGGGLEDVLNALREVASC